MEKTPPANENKNAEPIKNDLPFQHDQYKSHADWMAELQSGKEQAITANVWITTGLILLAMAGAAFLLWPTAQKIEQHEEKISQLSEEKPVDVSGWIPEDMQKKMDDMQNQARNLQATVTQLSDNAENLKQTMFAENSGPLSERLAKLETQITELTGSEDAGNVIGRIRKLEATLNGQMQLSDAMKELQTMVGAMDGRVDTMEGDLAKAKENQTALGQTLEGVSPEDMKAAAMLVAFSQMRESLNRQGPFEDDLALLQKMVGEDNPELQAALTKLAPQAQTGVLTSEGLSQEFKGLAGDIVVASLKGEDVSVGEQFKSRLGGMFKLEKDGQPLGGTPTQVTVTKAQALLDKGDIKGATALLNTLEGPAAQTAAPFLAQAQKTLMTEDVQTMVYQTILSKLGKGVPAMGGAVPAVPNIDLNTIKQEAEKIIPNLSGDMVKDEESGVAITPKQNKFKGFSAGQ